MSYINAMQMFDTLLGGFDATAREWGQREPDYFTAQEFGRLLETAEEFERRIRVQETQIAALLAERAIGWDSAYRRGYQDGWTVGASARA